MDVDRIYLKDIPESYFSMPRNKKNTGKSEPAKLAPSVNTFAALMDDDSYEEVRSSNSGSVSGKSGSYSPNPQNSGSNNSYEEDQDCSNRDCSDRDCSDSDGFVTVGRRGNNRRVAKVKKPEPAKTADEDGWTTVGPRKPSKNKRRGRSRTDHERDDNHNNDYGERIEKTDKAKSGSFDKPRSRYVFNPSSNFSSGRGGGGKYNRYNKTRPQSYQKNDDREYTDAQYFDPSEVEEIKGDDMSLNTPWKVWIHANNTDDWGLDSYDSGSKIDSVGQLMRFLYDFESLNKRDFQYFVMRNEIAPIWEDMNNKDGVITSIKINLGNRDDSYDIGAMAFKVICILVLNEAFVKNNTDINGVCFSIKNNSPHIKIWVKDRTRNGAFEKGLPMALLRQFETLIESNRRYNSNYYRGGARPVSVLTKNIKPDE